MTSRLLVDKIEGKTTSGTIQMPSGFVVQTIMHRSGSVATHNTTNTVELSSDYRATITPKFQNSKIIVHATINVNPRNAVNTVFMWKMRRFIGGGSFSDLTDEAGTNTGSRNRVSSGGATRRGNGYDLNDQNQLVWFAIDTPNTTNSVTYSPHMKQEASGTADIVIGRTDQDNDNYGTHGFYQMTLQEIAQ